MNIDKKGNGFKSAFRNTRGPKFINKFIVKPSQKKHEEVKEPEVDIQPEKKRGKNNKQENSIEK